MLLFFSVILKELSDELYEKGRDYPWPRPQKCPRCGTHVIWGHGFVSAIFDDFKTSLFSLSGSVVRLRPSGYFSRFQSTFGIVRESIAPRIKASGSRSFPGAVKPIGGGP
jgi:hypothetical protein